MTKNEPLTKVSRSFLYCTNRFVSFDAAQSKILDRHLFLTNFSIDFKSVLHKIENIKMQKDEGMCHEKEGDVWIEFLYQQVSFTKKKKLLSKQVWWPVKPKQTHKLTLLNVCWTLWTAANVWLFRFSLIII